MNREIKFRAWDKKDKLMYEVFDMKKAYVFSKGKNWLNIEIMQYTGLKDKNGKEIYEGDIVHYFSGIGDRLTVCGWDYKYYGWRFSGFYYDEADFDFIEVIGNIYETPELLK